MFYLLDLAPVEQNIAKQAMRSGKPSPERIANAPELTNGLQVYLQAFFDLDAERTHALALTPIPWTSINAYSKAYGFDEEQTEDLLYLIRKMDNAHLARLSKKQPKAGKK